MIAENFSWIDSIYLHIDGMDLDLHNCFDFRRLHYDIATQTVMLEWFKNSGKWVPENMPETLKLTMKEVSQFEFRPREGEMPFTEGCCGQPIPDTSLRMFS